MSAAIKKLNQIILYIEINSYKYIWLRGLKGHVKKSIESKVAIVKL